MERIKFNDIRRFHNGKMVNDHRQDIDDWVEGLKYIHKELDRLLGIKDKTRNAEGFREKVVALKQENQKLLRSLNIYRSSLEKAMECDTTECDTFFMKNHQASQNGYQKYLEKYLAIKSKV